MQLLIDKAKELLRSGETEVIIGYEKFFNKTRPLIVKTESDADKLVFNHYAVNNLAVYLTRFKDIKSKIGIVAKGCDIRAIIALIQEKQIKREQVYIIGINCNGVVRDSNGEWSKDNLAYKCYNCDIRTPIYADCILGEIEEMEKPEKDVVEYFIQFNEMNSDERWNFWEKQFEKCLRCYACRQVCPLCYCEQCIADKTTPRWIESSASLRGNFAWNMIRALHLAGRCIGCNECERACPVDIPLSLINRRLSVLSEKEFNYRHGMNIDEPTLVGSYRTEDRQDFIK